MRWTAAVDWLALIMGLALGGLFFYGGLLKRLEPYQFAEAVLAYDLLPQALVGLVAAILPWLELTSGFFLALGYLLEFPGRLLSALGFASGEKLTGGIKRPSCLLLIGGELVIFLVVLLLTLARGLRIDCGCGLLWARQVGWGIILEDALMLAVAGFLYWWELPHTRESFLAPGRRIDDFRGDYAFLSNFFPAPVIFEGVEYPTVEHAYQAAKTLDQEARKKLKAAATPELAKKLGGQLPIRPDWPQVKVQIMRELLRQKFQRHPELRELLRHTGDAELVEGNTWHDNFWGACRCARCNGVPGRNWLGRLLMEVRNEIAASPKS
jgi:ribA/ribD-fused uncharacterized protein